MTARGESTEQFLFKTEIPNENLSAIAFSTNQQTTPSDAVEYGAPTRIRNVVRFEYATSYTDLPTNLGYNYTYSEQIYTPEEVGGAKEIESISFFKIGAQEKTRKVSLYLFETTSDRFMYNTDWSDLIGAKKVFSGEYTFTGRDWCTITLDEPYNYYGDENLVVCLSVAPSDDNITEDYFWIKSTFQPRNNSLYLWENANEIDPSSLSGTQGNLVMGAVHAKFMGGTIQTIGDVASGEENSFLPFNSLSPYSYSQQIYTSEEIGGAKAIDGIAFKQTTYGNINGHATLFLGEISNDNFASNSTWYTGEALNQVFDGNITFDNGWCYISFDHPYYYTGNGNLLVSLKENSRNYFINKFLTETTSFHRSNSIISSNEIDPNNLDNNNQGNWILQRNVIQLHEANVTTVGDSSWSTQPLPTHIARKYSYSQQIISSADMGGAKKITSISFKQRDVENTTTTREVEVYFAEVDKAQFEDESDFIGINQFTQVFDGQVSYQPGWVTINFATPFDYTGYKNLAVAFHDKTGISEYGYWFDATSTGHNSAIYADASGQDIDLNGNIIGTSTSEYLNVFRFGSIIPQVEAIVGDTNSSDRSSYYPTNTFYKYSYSQQIFTPNEIGGEQTIYGLSLYLTTVGQIPNRDLTIYMTTANISEFNSNTSWVTAGLTEVFSGIVAFENEGWVTINFDTPYQYNGSENLIVAFDDNSGTYLNYFHYFMVSPTDRDMSICAYADNTNINPEAPMAANARDGQRNVIRFNTSGTDENLVEIGTENPSSYSYLPLNSRFLYSYTQQIYRSEEINQSGNIYSVSFKYISAEPLNRHIDIYMGEKSNDRFQNVMDWLPASNMTLVYSGDISVENPGWFTINLDQPFNYSGNNHLVIAVDDNTNSEDNSTDFEIEEQAFRTTIHLSTDLFNPNPYQMGNEQGLLSSKRNTIQLDFNMRYNITAQTSPAGASTITGTGEYPLGTEVVLTANDAEGYTFIEWNDGNTENPRTIIVNGNKHYTANYLEGTFYHISGSANIEGAGTVEGGGLSEENTLVTLTAVPTFGYRFVEWGDGETSNPRTIVVTQDTVFTANFEYYLYTPQSNANWYAFERTNGNHPEQFVGFNMSNPSIVRETSTQIPGIACAEKVGQTVYYYSTDDSKIHSVYIPEGESFIENPATLSTNTINVLSDMAVDPTNNTLYAIEYNDNGTDYLVTIDKQNGTITNQLSTGVSIAGFTIDREGNAYVISISGDLFRLNLSTGQASFIASTILHPGYINYMTMACDRNTNEIFFAQYIGSGNPDNGIFHINTTDGTTMLVGLMDNDANYTGLFIGPNITEIVLGDTNTMNQESELPVDINMEYSYSQQIFHPEEVGYAGDFYGLKLNYLSNEPFERDIVIYMGETEQYDFVDKNSWLSFGTFTEVYNGTMSANGSGWINITFDTPFHYSGINKLAIAFDDNTGQYNLNAGFFQTNDIVAGAIKTNASSDINPMMISDGSPGSTIFARNVFRLSTAPLLQVTVNVGQNEAGSVNGAGSYEAGETAELIAIANPGYIFTSWSDGNNDNPRYLVVTQDTTITANFMEDVYVPRSTATWYAYENGSGDNAHQYIYFNMRNTTDIRTTSDPFLHVQAAEYVGNTLYYYSYDDKRIHYMDITTDDHYISETNSSLTDVDPSIDISEMSYDVTTNTMYFTSYTGVGDELYSIDLTNGDLTDIGNMQITSIGFAIDGNGNAYSIDPDGFLFQIDLGQGTGISLGWTGIIPDDGEYMTMGCDRNTNELFFAMYVANGDIHNAIYYIDTVEAKAHYVGLMDNGANYTGLLVGPNACTTIYEDIYVESCQAYTWNGQEYSSSDDYEYQTTAANGCDSIAILHLTINQAIVEDIYETACESYTWNGQTYTITNDYEFHTTAANGCDSTAILHLTITGKDTTDVYVNSCTNYYWINTMEYYQESDTYYWTTTNSHGCDSTVALHLTINHPVYTDIREQTCQPYTWHGQTYNTGGDYFWYGYGLAANGCDSVVHLELTFVNEITTNVYIDTCTSITWNNLECTQSDTYEWRTNGRNGCDSVVTLHLTINRLAEHIYQNACGSYEWHGNTYNQDDDYEWIKTNEDGCDSIYYLHLTFSNEYRTDVYVDTCTNYTWNDSTFTRSTEYTWEGQAENGCDSFVTLHLSIERAMEDVYIDTCRSITWNGQVYNESGDYEWPTTAADGCDSIVTLHLNLYPVYEYIYEDVCQDSYTWNGETYVENGDYEFRTTATDGCDSIVTLYLSFIDLPDTIYTEALTYTSALPYYYYDEYYDTYHELNTAGIHYINTYYTSSCPVVIAVDLTVEENYTPRSTGRWYVRNWNNNTYDGHLVSFYMSAPDALTDITDDFDAISAEYINNSIYYLANDNTYALIKIDYPQSTMELGEKDTIVYTQHYFNEISWNPTNNTLYAIEYENPDFLYAVDIENGDVTYIGQLDIVATGFAIDNDGIAYAIDPYGDFYQVDLQNATTNYLFSTPLWHNDSYYMTMAFDHSTDELFYAFYEDDIAMPIGIYYIDRENEEVKYVGPTDYVYTGMFLGPTPCSTIYADIDTSACERFTWEGQTYNVDTDLEWESGTAINGCDSVTRMQITINHATTGVLDMTVLENQTPVYINGTPYYTTDNYQQHGLINAAGCDSTLIIHLTVLNNVSSTLDSTICSNAFPFTWNGVTFNEATSASATIPAANNTDSIIYMTVYTIPAYDIIINETACESYTWNGQTYTESDDYVWQNTTVNGCDSIVTLHLTINHSVRTDTTATACESFTWHGQTYTESDDYEWQDTTINGCDSIVTLHLTINHSVIDTIVIDTCDAYTWNGITYTSSRTIRMPGTGSNGCDSTTVLLLTIRRSVSETLYKESCGAYTWNDSTYTQSGIYSWTGTAANGCDSIVTLHLTISEPAATDTTVTACGFFTWNDSTYTQSGDYTWNGRTLYDCDSTVTLHLTINPVTIDTITQTACSEYTWNDSTYTQSGDYTWTGDAANGCDSIVTLLLTINQPVYVDTNVTACESYAWNGTVYTQTDDYSTTSTAANGCDSIFTLHLTINQPSTGTLNATVLENNLPYIVNNESYDTTGVYTQPLTNAAGCDSTLIINLTVLQNVSTSLDTIICANELPINWNGYEFQEAGFAIDTLIAADGTDSVVIMNVIVNQPAATDITVVTCRDYTWNDSTYARTGDYTWTGSTTAGCDSIVTLHLTITDAITTEIADTACEFYTWNGQTYTESNDYVWQDTTVNGCDSIVTLHLVINQPVHDTISVTACDNYTWNGNTYTQSDEYTWTGNAANGCDSIVTLFLTINNSVYDTLIVSTCDAYTWNGQTYTESNEYIWQDTTVNGCDSIVTLLLTINHSAIDTLVVSACNSYTWNGNTYTQSDEYVWADTTANGCDSIVTLFLTITESAATEIAETACGSYEWNGNTYTQSGDYTWTGTAANECDSVVTLHLTISTAIDTYIADTACGRYEWNGNTYTESGTYTWTGTAANGCDSIVTLNLIVNPIPTLVISGNTDIVVGDSTTLTVSGALTYMWSTGDIADNITVAPTTTTTYVVVGIDVNYCSALDSIEVSVSTGINEYTGVDVNVFPNPVENVLHLQTSANVALREYRIYDAMGKLVRRQVVSDNEGEILIDVTTFAPGTYYLQCVTDQSAMTKKFIKQQ